MTTKVRKKRPAKVERDEADRLFTMLLLLEASDYRPGAPTYYLSDNVFAGGKPADVDYAKRPNAAGGMILKAAETYPAQAVEVIECLPVGAEARRKLATLWGTVSGPVPAELCRTSTAVVHGDTGRVMARRSDYRFNPMAGRGGGGTAWFPFPLPAGIGSEERTRTTAGGNTGTVKTYYDQKSGGEGGPDYSCSLAVNFLTACDRLSSLLWSVSFTCIRSGVAVRLFTSVEGVAGFYSLRDASESGRRAALLHWVRSHTRKIAPAVEADVRGHYRGKDSFRWFGFEAAVHSPAKEDK